MRVLLAGLGARRGLNTAALLLTVFAVAAAVLGPMYARASGEHLLDSRLVQQPPYATGLSMSLPAMPLRELPHGDPDRFTPPVPQELVADAARVVDGPGVDRFWGPERRWLLDRGGVIRHFGVLFQAPLYWREGMCRLAEVTGRCPRQDGEALVQADMADALGVRVGDHVSLGYSDKFIKNVRLSGTVQAREVDRLRTVELEVVGTYRITAPGTERWYDSSRFTGIENLVPPPPSLGGTGTTPVAPALLVAPSSMHSQTFQGGVDRAVDRSKVNLDTLSATTAAATGFTQRLLEKETADPLQDLALGTIVDGVRAERSLLSRIMVAALAPLVVLALLLLYALVAAAADVRRPYVALAKLRGHSRGQVLRFALSEPFLVVLVATPVGVGLAVLAARLIAGAWLVPGIPVRMDAATAVALVVVVGAALLASAVAAFGVVREPLSSALASSVRPRPPSRLALVLRSAVVAVAVASVAQLLTSGDQSNQLLALLAPLLIALAVAVGGAALLKALARSWVRRTADRGGAAAFLAARRLARRRDLANLMIPLLLAVSVITFAASASAVSGDWRVSRARAEVGAARTYLADASAGRLLRVTRAADPDGRYIAAAVVDNSGDGTERRVLMDTTRLAAVTAWDPSWSTEPVSALQRRLVPRGEPITFHGSRVAVAVGGVHLQSRSSTPSYLWLQYVTDTGDQRDAVLGRLVNGRDATLTARLSDCQRRCEVQQLYLAGDSRSVSDTQGEFTIGDVSVDGVPTDWGLAGGDWRPARPFPVSLIDPPVELEPQATGGLRVRVFLRQLPPGDGPPVTMISGFARITPRSTPEVVPMLVTRSVRTTPVPHVGSGLALTYPDDPVVATALNGQQVPADVVARVEAVPVLGREGTLADLQTALTEFPPPAGAVTVVELWANADTPPAVLDKVRSAGVPLTPLDRLDETLHELRSDAFSVGLRLFLVVGVATLLLAVFGVFASAVLQSRWRSYEVASLRVVGVSRRSLTRGSVLEYVVMLGVAVLLGLVSAWVSLRLVLPSISLGPASEDAPLVDYGIHWSVLGVVGVVLFGLAAGIALVVSRRIIRLGRPATLRWAEQG
jgi:putative ABC transport system permease protein